MVFLREDLSNFPCEFSRRLTSVTSQSAAVGPATRFLPCIFSSRSRSPLQGFAYSFDSRRTVTPVFGRIAEKSGRGLAWRRSVGP